MGKFGLIFLVAVIFSGGCSARGGAPGGEFAYAKSSVQAADQREASLADSGESGAGTGNVPERQKLVKRADIRLRVEDPAATDAVITAVMEKYGAYASSTNINENFRDYTIRLPSASYDSLLAEMSGLGRLLHRSENAEDVTLRYYDLEGRLATKRELLKTFQSYLGKAKDIEEILSVESRIAELQDEIDGTGKELRYLANLVDFATLELSITGPVSNSYSAPGLGERFLALFSGFSEFASTVLVVLMGIVIYGIPSILILTLLFWILFGRIGLLKKLLLAASGRSGSAKRNSGESAARE
ncbi:putative lipoprotein [Treponema primitia ZAS-2]|uniref:Putative lipoprotein n=1 Tax=Treponema primitia (strain ATCC BAA-887 / DSM 12427 / ZAS-2) TaxID=545694 RepID=F5YHZ5_TREPZ|nr:DUF4349 domain-containing protein [Treponema primitia]AEF86815.1 putative lipoprotein [Treponema primitia ZAS-2]